MVGDARTLITQPGLSSRKTGYQSDRIQIFFAVIQEIPVYPVIIRILVFDLLHRYAVKTIDIGIRVREKYWRMSCDDKLGGTFSGEMTE